MITGAAEAQPGEEADQEHQADDRHVVGLGDDVPEVVVGHAQAEVEQEHALTTAQATRPLATICRKASIAAMKAIVAPMKKVVGPETASIRSRKIWGM